MPLVTSPEAARQLRELKREEMQQEQPMVKPFGGDQGEFDQRRTMSGPNGQRMTPEEHAKMMAAARALRGK